MVRLIPRTDPEANVLAYQAMENPLKKVLQSYANRNIRDTMKKVTGLLKDHGYDGTNRNTVMIKQASPSTIRSLEELGQRLPDGRRQAFQSKLYGQIGSGSLTVRKAVNDLLNYGTMQDVDRLYKDGRDVLRETAKEGMYRGEFMVQKSVGVGWTMETPGIKQVDAFLKDHWSMRDATSYMRPMSDALKDQVEEALFMGESPQKMAKRIQTVEDISDVRANRNARTITTAVANEAQMGQYKKDGIKMYRWVATFDERTCPECGHLDGQEFDLGKQAYPPLHPNCRCTTEAVLDKDADSQINKILEAHKNDPRAKYVPKSMNYDQWKAQQPKSTPRTERPEQPTRKQKTVEKVKTKAQVREERYSADAEKERAKVALNYYDNKRKAFKDLEKETFKNLGLTDAEYKAAMEVYDEAEAQGKEGRSAVLRELDNDTRTAYYTKVDEAKTAWKHQHVGDNLRYRFASNNVQYNPVKVRETPLSEQEIIKEMADWDKTKGSCASQAMGYIGQKTGLDIQDFRGGDSRAVFAMGGVRDVIRAVDGEHVNYAGIRECKKMLKRMQPGEEYVLCAGHHCAIVRMGEERPEYLELQASGSAGGWQKFGWDEKSFTKELRYRFDVQDRSISADMANIKDIMNREDIMETLGYINTPLDKALRGSGGGIK